MITVNGKITSIITVTKINFIKQAEILSLRACDLICRTECRRISPKQLWSIIQVFIDYFYKSIWDSIRLEEDFGSWDICQEILYVTSAITSILSFYAKEIFYVAISFDWEQSLTLAATFGAIKLKWKILGPYFIECLAWNVFVACFLLLCLIGTNRWAPY